MQKKQKKRTIARLAPRPPKRKSGGVRLPNGPPPAKKPRQARLPGLEDSAIKDLEEAAIEHCEAQTELRERRAALKLIDVRIITLMKQNGKRTYNRGGIHLKLRDGHDDVSVQVKRHDRQEDMPQGKSTDLAEEEMPF